MTEIEKARELFVSCRLKEAKPLLEELAGAGDSDALYMLAMMTYDVDIAIELLAKSAAKGNAGAKLMRLALMADASEETIAEAEKSIIPEIEKGAEEDPVLADALGTFYLVYGKKREGWTEKGMESSAMQLGVMYYEDGKDDKAFEIFRKSAENGYPASMGWLAACYENGYGTERNREMAKFWLTRAADLGDEDAKKALSIISGNG